MLEFTAPRLIIHFRVTYSLVHRRVPLSIPKALVKSWLPVHVLWILVIALKHICETLYVRINLPFMLEALSGSHSSPTAAAMNILEDMI